MLKIVYSMHFIIYFFILSFVKDPNRKCYLLILIHSIKRYMSYKINLPTKKNWSLFSNNELFYDRCAAEILDRSKWQWPTNCVTENFNIKVEKDNDAHKDCGANTVDKGNVRRDELKQADTSLWAMQHFSSVYQSTRYGSATFSPR